MDKQEKIKIAITSGIAAVVLLILVLFIGLSGKKNNDQEKLDDNIAKYADSAVSAVSVESAATSEAVISSTEASATEASSAPEALDETKEESKDQAAQAASTSQTTVKKAKAGDTFYQAESAILKDVYKGMKVDVNAQLKEMYAYWADNNMEAVRDLAHLKRFEAMSFALSNSADFYYYGDKNSQGLPEGKGLALYANDQYYFGDWSNGVRSGNGTWVSFYPEYSTGVVKEHLFTGKWSKDLPEGEGQEHLDYAVDKFSKGELYLQNAIGGFFGGKYNGDMYIMLQEDEDSSTEWVGKCTKGSWEQVLYAAVDNSGKIPVLTGRENSETHIYMTKDGAKNSGISGIITGGKPRD